ncbi:APH(6) family putative aminoglycoside O-phosphotransferase, partial [Stenotrophomonas maltophilia]
SGDFRLAASLGIERMDVTRLLRWIAAVRGVSAVWFRDDGDPAEVDEAVARLALEALAAG